MIVWSLRTLPPHKEHTMNKSKRQDIFQSISETIVAFLKEGVKKQWVRPWKVLFSERGQQVSLQGRPYGAVNQLLLLIYNHKANYKSNVWATYNAWADKGYQVQKGQKGYEVCGWFATKVVAKDREGNTVIDPETGKPKMIELPRLKRWIVFNGSQVKNEANQGYAEVEQVEVGKTWEDEGDHIPKVQAIIDKFSIQLEHGGSRAFYSPVNDGYIQMPRKEDFISLSEYYGTLTHEIVHWTGHDDRTKRHQKIRESKKDFNNQDYAFEELVAEIGSCFFDKYLNIETDAVVANHLAYVQSWIKGLEENPYIIERASKYAQEAIDFLIEEQEETSSEVASEEEMVLA